MAGTGHSTIGTSLSYGEPLKRLYSVTEIPDLGAEREMVPATTLADDKEVGVPGVQSNGTLTFNGNIGKYGPPAGPQVNEFAELMKLNPLISIPWQVDFPDGSKFEFEGYPNVYPTGVAVNGVLQYALNIIPSSGTKYTEPPETPEG